MTASAPSPYPAPGEIIDGAWRVEKVLGEGGMGAVALAWDLFLHTPVAIKFMNPQFLSFPGAEQRFLNEGRASALIKNDHVVPVTKAGKTASGVPFLVMEALEGRDLSDVIAHDGTPGLPVERAVHFVLQALRALQSAHAIGIIHRDMKPSNCFAVVKDGEADFVKVLDFGISKVQQAGSASLTQTNSALGTPLYMSPEQARSPRDVDARSDLYSVGVILYELLTGRTPFSSESGEFTEILFKLFTMEPPPVQSVRPDIPDGLAAVVHKALARAVSERFGSALEMAEALAPWASERSKELLVRMRAFKAPKAGESIAPPADLPESMVAFSQIGGSTGVMPNRPTTDVMAGPPVTAILQNVGDRSPGGPFNSAPHLAPPPGTGNFRSGEATARTEYDSNANIPIQKPMAGGVSGASTDLGAARDTSLSAGSPSRSRWVLAVPVLSLLAVGGVATIVVTRASKPSSPTTGASAQIMAQTSPVMTSTPHAEPAASASAVSSGTASASSVTSAPSAQASAKPTAATASVSSAGSTVRPSPSKPPHGTTTSVLDTTIKN